MPFSPKTLPIIVPLLFSLFSFINTDCSMAQDNETMVRPAVGNETTPHRYQEGNNTYCTDFIDQDTCCTPFQMQQLLKNFEVIESIFGGDGGCDACVVNLKRFWCYFTCSPEQARFIKLGNLTNYTIDGTVWTLRDINFSITDETNCDLFHSCQKTKFVAQVPSMGNAIGFTNFQGINAYSKTPVYISMQIDNENGLSYDNDPCNIVVPANGDIRGYANNSNCSCNSCKDNCNFSLNAEIPFMNGVNVWLIVGVYIFVFVATLLLFFYKRNQKSKVANIVENQDNSLERSTEN